MFIGDFKQIGVYFSIKKYEEEFEQGRICTNICRCHKAAVLLLIMNIILLLIDLTIYRPMINTIKAYLYLCYSHIILIFFMFFWLSIYKVYTNINSYAINEALYYILINVVLYWCVFLSINGLSISGQVFSYIICSLVISTLMYLSPSESLIVYLSSVIVFIIELCIRLNDTKVLMSNIVNAVIVVFFSLLISNMNYINLVKDFINKKNILQNKMELEATNQKLKEYEKLRTDFFANISHELRTPLNVIYSAEQMMGVVLKQNNVNIEKMDKYMNMMKQNSFRLVRLINNLIDITKIDAASFNVLLANYDIVKIVEDITMSVVDYVEEKGLTLTFDTEVEEKVIACDPDIIERIVLNLLSNSIKFTEDKGNIFVNLYVEGDNICVSVRDTGIGISEQMKELIFDRFVQVDKSIKRKREGSGIGLALVKSLAEMHGGSIRVNSDLGKGSEFIVSLPDIMIKENEQDLNACNIINNHVEKINIEFSDIYQ